MAEYLVSVLAFLLRVQGLTFQSLWRDEVDSLRFASQPLGDLLQRFLAPGQNGSLYYLLLRPWLTAAGDTEFSLRFFSVLAGTLAVPLVYHLGRRLDPSSPSVGLAASLLTAVSPYLVWYSQEARMYAAVVTLVLGAFLCLLSGLERGRWPSWLGYALLTGSSIYFHFLAVFMVPVDWVAIFILRRRNLSGSIRRYLAVLGCLAVLYTPLAIWQIPQVLHPDTGGYEFVPLSQVLASLAITYSSGVVLGPPWSLMPLLVLVCAAITRTKRDQSRPVGVLAVWLLLPVLALFLVTLVKPLYTARYLAYVLPAFLLLAGFGVRSLARRRFSVWLAGFLTAAIVASSLLSVRLQATTVLKADMRSAAGFVSSFRQADERVMFLVPYARYSFQYYAHEPVADSFTSPPGASDHVFLPLVMGLSGASWWVDGPYTNGGMSPAELDAAMVRLAGEGSAIWLVASEASLWDARGLVQDWLEGHAIERTQVEFIGVTVSRYELR